MLQRIYTFIKQWETLSLLFLFFRGFLLHEILRKPWGKIHMQGGHEALTEAKKMKEEAGGTKNGINRTKIRWNIGRQC